MNVVLNGEKVTVPFCTCGKCILRRNRDHNSSIKYPYNRNLSSTYASAHNLKPFGDSAIYFNRSKNNNFDSSYREHLPSLLMSTMKFDYKPYKIKLDPTKQETVKVESIPFWGKSSYATFYPDWGVPVKSSDNNKRLPHVKIPFRGASNYGENYKNFEKRLKLPTFKPSSSLGFKGKVFSEPKDWFKDFDKNVYTRNENPRKSDKEKSYIIPANYPKDFNSTYRVDYKGSDIPCELADYLKNRGLKKLEL